jgi:UPF0716 protein FxsA
VPLLFLLFVVTPFVELWILLQVGSVIGAWWTLGLVIGTGALGAWLARREGLRAVRRFVDESNRGVLPGVAIFDGVAIFLGGALLLTPGIVTDLIGFVLLLPPTRALVRGVVLAWVGRKLASGNIVFTSFGSAPPAGTPPPGPARPGEQIYDQTLDEEESNRRHVSG